MSNKTFKETLLEQKNELIMSIVAEGVKNALSNSTIDLDELAETYGIDRDRISSIADGSAKDITLLELLNIGLCLDMLLQINFEPLY